MHHLKVETLLVINSVLSLPIRRVILSDRAQQKKKKKGLVVSKETHIDRTLPPKTAECSMVYKFSEPLFQAIGKPTRRVAVRHCRPSAIAAATGGLLAAAN